MWYNSYTNYTIIWTPPSSHLHPTVTCMQTKSMLLLLHEYLDMSTNANIWCDMVCRDWRMVFYIRVCVCVCEAESNLSWLLGGSGRVVNSLDFCLALLKSLGCFYFQCILSSQWKVVTVNLRILHCQLWRYFWRPIVRMCLATSNNLLLVL